MRSGRRFAVGDGVSKVQDAKQQQMTPLQDRILQTFGMPMSTRISQGPSCSKNNAERNILREIKSFVGNEDRSYTLSPVQKALLESILTDSPRCGVRLLSSGLSTSDKCQCGQVETTKHMWWECPTHLPMFQNIPALARRKIRELYTRGPDYFVNCAVAQKVLAFERIKKLPSPSCPTQDVWRKYLLGLLGARLICCLSV